MSLITITSRFTKSVRHSGAGVIVQQRAKTTRVASQAAIPHTLEEKQAVVQRLLAAKEASNKSFDEIAKKLGLTNVYTANLFFLQAQLKSETAKKLKTVVPGLSDSDIDLMQRSPMRSYNPAITQEPNVYRTMEAVLHNGEAVKALINEKFGDGIMSAIDFYYTVDEVQGKAGERRVVLTMNGKFLPHVEQTAADNTASRS